MSYLPRYDVIVVGGGHAGTEAALAAVRVGAKTLIVTHSSDTFGQMSCNPAVGGIGKSHLVKEIDALDGWMARATDQSGIQFRVLNAKKGPAVRATRAQADRALYKRAMRAAVENQRGLSVFQEAVESLIIENNRVQGVVTKTGLRFFGKTVVLAVGTFLNGKIHMGSVQFSAGRAGDPSSIGLAEFLRTLPFRVGRLKTGTPARIDGKSVDFSVMEKQPGDDPTPVFSFLGSREEHPRQIDCYITHTNEKTHDIIRQSLHLSALFSGAIEGVGPRYCPSIEDKIVRFEHKSSHQIFIEPEGLSTSEIYPNGISTSLPMEVQQEFIHSIRGLEHAHITRPGYAIEYDFFDPRELKPSLETKSIEKLFFAGQINGTTGYEEAAAQGLVAGLNAARVAQDQGPWTPKRHEAYIGVLIDDLITKGTKEPYRMFTSRAEYRLMLREDNADLRLTEQGRALGLVGEERWKAFNQKMENIEKEKARLGSLCIHPKTPLGQAIEQQLGQSLPREMKARELLKRPEVKYKTLMQIEGIGPGIEDVAAAEQIEIEAKYAGYIERQGKEIERQARYEAWSIPDHFDFEKVRGLSTEVLQHLKTVRPKTVGMASRIPGVTPAAISLLLVYLKKM